METIILLSPNNRTFQTTGVQDKNVEQRITVEHSFFTLSLANALLMLCLPVCFGLV
jgi:hypothetical protein